MLFTITAAAQMSTGGMIATPDSHATRIAEQILQQGGNAVDAGVAAMFALGVVQPYATGMGGGGLMLIHRPSDQTATLIDFREQALQQIDPKIYYQDETAFRINTKSGPRSIAVPGMMAGATTALQLHGSKSLQEVVAPSIQLASNGFSVSHQLARMVEKYYDHLESNQITSQTFLPDWLPIEPGETMIRRDLAQTMKLITDQGEQAFYRGEIANQIIRELNSHDINIQAADLRNYKPQLTSALVARYRNYEILTAPLPARGGWALLTLLRILQAKNVGQFPLNSGPYVHIVAEAMRLVYTEQQRYLNGQVEEILSDEQIARMASQIDTAGTIALPKEMDSEREPILNGAHISVIDRQGNAVSISLSLGSPFGSAVTIARYGILMNNALIDFSPQPGTSNSLQPGRKPLTTLTPTMVLKNGQPFLILGGNGGEQTVSMLAQIIINVVDFHLSLDEAIRSPRFHYNSNNHTVEMETRIEASAIEYLKSRGHKINLRTDYDAYFGNCQAVMLAPAHSQFSAVNDIRQEREVYYHDLD
ncbi:MAG: gamma-glutamyltransferase [candidate division KSB1 bacterium]|nr:gamma-glutamyltransferase [candidate division KSB1 bacterium]MDZ7341685.1 gamma-glutamyltransferase [candidate division KSB1 bacterium]